MNALERLYYDFMNDNDIKDTEDKLTALERVDKAIVSVIHDETIRYKTEDLTASYSTESEKQGFMNGFKYAMRLKNECLEVTQC